MVTLPDKYAYFGLYDPSQYSIANSYTLLGTMVIVAMVQNSYCYGVMGAIATYLYGMAVLVSMIQHSTVPAYS